jgi:DNA-binding transcriptional MerR regulator
MWKVGELARLTGVSVRTLHHYDRIGLVSPKARTASGHRLYGREEVQKLRDVRALVSLGLSLAEIQKLLARPGFSPEHALLAQKEKLRSRLAMLRKLLKRLDSLEDASTTEELIAAIKETEMTEKFEKYYTPEQLQTLAKRGETIGAEAMLQAQRDWAKLYDDMRVARRQGLAPSHPRVQALARESRRLIEEFTGGDAGIEASLANMYHNEEGMRREYLPEPELAEYMAAATAKLEGGS